MAALFSSEARKTNFSTALMSQSNQMAIKEIEETISTGEYTSVPQMTGIPADAIQNCATLKLWKLSRETGEHKSLHFFRRTEGSEKCLALMSIPTGKLAISSIGVCLLGLFRDRIARLVNNNSSFDCSRTSPAW